MAGQKQTTITDVAKHAGVSLATVSRVMNGNATVDPTLAERVRTSATELGYSANPLARSLVLGKTQTISVVVPDLSNPTFQGMLRGLSRAAVADGYHVLVADSDEHEDQERLLALESRRRSDGLVLCAPRMSDAALAEVLAEVAPVVLVNRAGDAPASPRTTAPLSARSSTTSTDLATAASPTSPAPSGAPRTLSASPRSTTPARPSTGARSTRSRRVSISPPAPTRSMPSSTRAPRASSRSTTCPPWAFSAPPPSAA